MAETNNETKRNEGLFTTYFLHNFWIVLKKTFWLPLSLGLLLGSIQFYREYSSYSPRYRSSAVFAVCTTSVSKYSSYSSYYNSSAAEKLTTTFSSVLASDVMHQLIREEAGSNIGSSVSVDCMASSSLFVITATGKTAEIAQRTLEAVVKVYPQAAANILGNITLYQVEKPTLPDAPFNTCDPWDPAIKWACVGIVLGLLFAVFLACLRKTIHTADDMRSLVNLSCLATLPAAHMKRRSAETGQLLSINNPHIPHEYHDSIRSLRYKLRKEMDSIDAKVTLVTSTLPGEGKTTVSVNLALSLAYQGRKVLLIDADLRKPSVKKALGITEKTEGLVELLENNSTSLPVYQIPGTTLMVLAGEKSTTAPQQLLSSKRMKRIIASAREQMDYIVIDTPPAAFLSDAATLSEIADCAVYVIRQDFANRTSILDSIRSLSNIDVRFAGCILNYAASNTTRHGYGYGYGKYGYGYGYGRYSYYGKSAYGKNGYAERGKRNSEPYVK